MDEPTILYRYGNSNIMDHWNFKHGMSYQEHISLYKMFKVQLIIHPFSINGAILLIKLNLDLEKRISDALSQWACHVYAGTNKSRPLIMSEFHDLD